MRALRYALDEAAASLWRGRAMSAVSVATIAVALFVLGGFLVVTSNLERLGDTWSETAEMSVYLDDQVEGGVRPAIESALGDPRVVAAYAFVSKEAALARFRETFADLAGTIDTLDENPLPASYEVRLQPVTGIGAALDALVARLRALPGVADVRYDREWLDRLQAIVAIIRGLGVALGGVLAVAAALAVGSVVRLALAARRDEIAIMQLVGAPGAYVRGPFIAEGILHGGIGALAALAALAGVYAAVHGRYLVPLAEALNVATVRFLPLELCLLVLAGGMAVGCVGGVLAAWGRT